jgi:hypothetical protein
VLPQVRRPEQTKEFKTFPQLRRAAPLEAFRIEYWALEEAKLQRMPPEKEFIRKDGRDRRRAGSGSRREVALQIASAADTPLPPTPTPRRGRQPRRRPPRVSKDNTGGALTT